MKIKMGLLTYIFGLKQKEEPTALIPQREIKRYNPYAPDATFPHGVTFADRNNPNIRYSLRGKRLTCLRREDATDEDEGSSSEKVWAPCNQEYLETETQVQAVGVLEEEFAEVIDSYFAESRHEDNARIYSNLRIAREIIRKGAIDPRDCPRDKNGNPSMPLIFLYEEISARTQANGCLGLYLPEWQFVNSKP